MEADRTARSTHRTGRRSDASGLVARRRSRWGSLVAALAFGWLLVPAAPLRAATFVVNTTADGTDGVCATTAGGCTLRDAIKAANATTAADIITLPAGTYNLTVAGPNEDLAATGDLDITKPVTINGAGAASTIIDGQNADRIFDIYDTAGNVTINGLTVRNGFSGLGNFAGGIWNSAILTLNGVRVETSSGRLGGGGILNDNDLTANDVTLTGNTTNSQGGGLYNTGVARLTRVTLSGNSSSAAGGGITNDGTLTLTNVTISGNTAVTDGGGLNNTITATLKSVTVASNGANRGGGIFGPGDQTIGNTIVANSTSGGNCNVSGGSLTSLGGNLDSANTCGFGAGDQINKNPLLTPLQNNGGPTQTHGIFPGSPAVDVGGSSCPGTLTTDQRGTGFPRVLDGDSNGSALCDSGAYELNPASPPTTTTTSTVTTTSSTSSSSTSSSTSRPSTSSSTSTSRPTTTSSTSSTSTSTSTSTSRPTTTSSTSSTSTSTSTSTSRPTTTSSTSSTSTSTSTSTSRPTTTSSTSFTSTSTTSSSTSSSRSTSTTTSTSTSTTTSSTTPGVGCGPARTDCIAPGDASVSIDEGTPGRERLKIVLRKLVPEVLQAQLGNPATGTTRYDVCVYDDALRLVGSLDVDRAGQLCGTRPCWRTLGTKGYRYLDRDVGADGVRSIVATGGAAGRGRIVVKARNDERRGQTAMPLGMTAALQLTQSVTVQAVTSDGACFGGTLTDVDASPTRFRAK